LPSTVRELPVELLVSVNAQVMTNLSSCPEHRSPRLDLPPPHYTLEIVMSRTVRQGASTKREIIVQDARVPSPAVIVVGAHWLLASAVVGQTGTARDPGLARVWPFLKAGKS